MTDPSISSLTLSRRYDELRKKASREVVRRTEYRNEPNHSIQRVHCALKSMTTMDSGEKQVGKPLRRRAEICHFKY